MVIIDGNDTIFNSNLMRQGESGGKQAAALLHDALTKWAVLDVSECPDDAVIAVRVYANIRIMGDHLTKAGLISNSTALQEFARGFTLAKNQFEFIDVDGSRDVTYSKVMGEYQEVLCAAVADSIRFIQTLHR